MKKVEQPEEIYRPFEIKNGKVIYQCIKCKGEREDRHSLFCKRCNMVAEYNRPTVWND